MISASGETFAKPLAEDRESSGSTLVRRIDAVEVGDRYTESGCAVVTHLICDKRFSSRNDACSSMISQSLAVKGSMWMV